MNAGDLYKAGKLAAAIDAQIADVRSHPLDQAKRVFLFELLMFAGDLERARRQAEAFQFEDMDLERAAANYRRLVDSEQARRDVFERGTAPGFFGEHSQHLRLRLEAVNCLRVGNTGEAASLLARAEEAMPAVVGSLNGQPFHALRDADDLFGGVLEVMANGRYFWVGLDQVRVAAMNPPSFPRDLLYIPTHLELESEAGEVFLPALYPGSHAHDDEAVRLGRLTDWKTLEDDLTLGVGLHTYLRDDDAATILEWREFRATGT
ncbi:ImpE protein [Aquisphaera giovannonii]|uniref:ImpE protein n=1 Tax=Aquisphaera giovannonii TaxID=406548 RepID=A0A5B9VZT0_9BACT|nr:type VI secretion system accessory protein TagJ [Aquisphaera giovannonii]QEH33818.1 ImpE protein [Aquisphaera giovannonii]